MNLLKLMQEAKIELTGMFAIYAYCWLVLSILTASPIIFITFISLIKKVIR